jgi:RNA polymerase sigma-70 factor, ECF subfamily
VHAGRPGGGAQSTVGATARRSSRDGKILTAAGEGRRVGADPSRGPGYLVASGACHALREGRRILDPDQRVARGDPTPPTASGTAPALADVYAEHFVYVWQTLKRLGVPARDAEDLAQEVFVVTYRRLDTFDVNRPIKPWLFGICFNVLRDHNKRASTRSEHLSQDGEIERDHSDPGFRAVEALEIVEIALLSIPPERRAVFVAYELDEMSMSDVADSLGIPVDTGYSRLRVARREFRDAVRRHQGEP